MTPPIFDDHAARYMNDARHVLLTIEKHIDSPEWEENGLAYGRLAEACHAAEAALFNVLNIAQAYDLVPLTKNQVQLVGAEA